MSVTPTSGFHGYHATNQVIERVREMPGVSAVTAGPLPLVKGSDGSTNAVIVDGMPVELSTPAEVIYTASDYFTTLRQPLVRGRDFAASDRQGTRPVAIVNEAAARQLWPGGDPLEHQIGFPPRGAPVVGGIDFAVVGIVRDAKIRQLSETGRPVVYLARLQHESYLAGMIAGSGNSFLIVRATGDPAALASELARIGEDAGLPLQAMTTVEQGVNEILMPQRLGRALLMLLGTLALTLTAVGIYGFVSYLVARNTKEIGIRMALGARPRVIVRAVLAGIFAPVAAGAVAGSILAWFAGHFADRFMYGIQGADPATVVIAIAAILVSGMLAVLLPTRRALRINPIETLRGD
jgi:hypothetical protein